MRKEKGHTTVSPTHSEELYRFGADGNLRLYSYDRLFYSLYGYDGGTTRTYKYSFDLTPNWVNGQLLDVQFNPHNTMFYPNSYLNFNQEGYYTKHYYNGMERIASRLGDQGFGMEQPTDGDLLSRKNYLGKVFTEQFQEMLGNQDSIKLHDTLQLRDLQPNPAGGLYYYHPNHLGSTCYVTDDNTSIVQGFLYAPFGEITNEYNSGWQNGTLPKYSFNAKELDEETGFYYYEARYYNPPTFISRDVLFEEYPTFSPYTYCANNPIKYIDPSGEEVEGFSIDEQGNVSINKKIASKDAIKIYEAMIKTETGTEAFKGMINRKTKITLNLTKKALFDNGTQVHGLTEADNEDVFDNGEYKTATITISTAEIKDNPNDRYNGFSMEEKINGIGTHESVHLDPLQIMKDNSEELSFIEQEREPVRIEYKSRLEYRHKYGKKNDRDINSNYINFLNN